MDKEEEFLITLADLFHLFKRSKRKIGLACFAFALIGALFGLSRPAVYVAKGSFRDKAPSESNNAQDVSASLKILGLSETGTSEALSWMQSRHLIGKLVKRLSLQAEIQNKNSLFDRFRDNLKVEKALWMNEKRPSLADLEKEMVVQTVNYQAEYPTELTVTPLDSLAYQVSNKGKVIGSGRFGEPFQTDNYSFTLAAPKNPKACRLTLWPQWKVVDDLVKTLQIKADTKDKTLFNLTYAHRDRSLACSCVNELMELYLEHMRYQHRFLLQEHLSYLQKRQDEMNENLKTVLEEHVSTLSSDLSTSGFPSTQSVIEYLSETLLQYTKSLHLIEMEIIRLKNFRDSGFAYHDQYRSEDDPYTINATLAEIRQLKKQSDVIELALKNNAPEQNLLAKFADLMKEHKNIHTYSDEVKEILEKLKGKQPLEKEYSLFQEPRYIAGVWKDRLQDSVEEADYRLCSSHFQLYLGHLDHFFDVYEKTLKERITHQQNPPDELQGMTLDTAQEVYSGYCKMQSDIESTRRQFEYVLDQMQNPQFEISSLSAILSDPVSQKMIEKASNVELLLKEEGNRSGREQDRLKAELATHRGFLQTHIRQSLELVKIREKLMHEKSYHLQQATLELIQQKISILEKYLEDFIETRLANLEQEKLFIYQQQAGLQQEMGKIPGKWVSEKMIDQQVKLNQQLMSELTKLVENKNISTNLEAVRSTPVDMALPSIHPRSPKIVFFSLLGAFLGLFFSCSYLFGRTMIDGLPVSRDNLRLSGQHVSGTTQDLETLRSLMAYFEMAKPQGDLLLILGRSPNYAEELATLLAMMEFRVLLLPLSFDKPGGEGLLAYLQGQNLPKIHKKGGFDYIEPGGVSAYSSELIGTQRFQKLYKDLSDRYDWVIAYTTASPLSAEAKAVSANFDRIAITLQEEKFEEILPWIKESKKITWIIN